jgi:hypothetical protein
VTIPFENFDLSRFFEDSAYALETYGEPCPSDTDVAAIERELGYRLPAAYVVLCRQQNGGIPIRTCFRTSQPTSWAEDHVAIHGIAAIGRRKNHSLCGPLGSRFMVREWGYPPLGVYFGDCPSAGHDMICLDYSQCGPEGEPGVVHVDQELDYQLTYLAPDFQAFIKGLESEEAFPLD